MTTSTNSDEILVRFTTEAEPSRSDMAPPPTYEAETQAFWNRKRAGTVKDVPMKVADLTAEINRVSGAIQHALDAPQPAAGGFRVDSFEVGLAINASGGVALVAEVGIEASIKVTFKRS